MNPDIHHNDTGSAISDENAFGAVDIVSAFTALRHDLKLQIRGGAEALESLNRRLDRLESTLQSAAKPPAASDQHARSFAFALAEIETALQRTIDGLRLTVAKTSRQTSATQIAEEKWRSASWLTRKVASSYYQQIIAAINSLELERSESDKRDTLLLQSIELLLARVHRLMNQQSMKRQDVTGLLFDSELMNAIAAVESSEIPPGHVVRQHKPAYFWNNALLSFAEVDVARSI
jgi:molecular chaperone GrpE (heat shock protein)